MKNISVIGSGTMGNGIAHIFAQNEFRVNLIDVSSQALEKALLTISGNYDRQIKKGILNEARKKQALMNISTHTSVEEGIADADLVIEAITEDLKIKMEIFKELDQYSSPDCILASNTSSISITRLASGTDKPDKVIGMHFMNPVPVMQLVEIIRGYNTSEDTARQIVGIAEKLGKIPVEVNDYPGFVSNRILMPMINEAIYILFQGIAGVKEIDMVMKMGMAHPMGPLQLADFIGLDVCLSILKVLQEGFGEAKYAPCPLLVKMVEGGHLGKKSGSGFYNWSGDAKELQVAGRFK
ncbi:MAG: 3-hydroxybutyryl-CoA dehydrogenase [Cyclobacteriaceae bacterium]|nr:3-hydroxybutyryl-CoA dehydrogenase [Cyclobacteriaceae bacterium]